MSQHGSRHCPHPILAPPPLPDDPLLTKVHYSCTCTLTYACVMGGATVHTLFTCTCMCQTLVSAFVSLNSLLSLASLSLSLFISSLSLLHFSPFSLSLSLPSLHSPLLVLSSSKLASVHVSHSANYTMPPCNHLALPTPYPCPPAAPCHHSRLPRDHQHTDNMDPFAPLPNEHTFKKTALNSIKTIVIMVVRMLNVNLQSQVMRRVCYCRG